MDGLPSELPQDRWFWVWLSIFAIVLGTSPFIIWDWKQPFWGAFCGVVGLAGLLMLVRDRLMMAASKWPIRASLKVLAIVALSMLLGQLAGYDIYSRRAEVAPYPIRWWGYGLVLLLIALVMSTVLTKRKTSKLVIHSANYRAVKPGGDSRDVGEFLEKIISGDSLVFDIENHNFVIDGHNYVPKDPFTSEGKRLQITYSYGAEPRKTIVRYEHDRLVLPEDCEIQRLTDGIARTKQEAAEQIARLNMQSESDLFRSHQVSDQLRAEVRAAKLGTGGVKSGRLIERAVEAEALAVNIENIWDLYNNKKETLPRPLSAKALPAWEEHHQQQLFRFRTIYQWHINSVKKLDSGFHSKAIDHGFPNENEYADVKRNLEEHAKLLRQLAGTSMPDDATPNLYIEKHRLEDELETLENPEPPDSLKDKTFLQSTMFYDVRPATLQESYEARQKELRIRRLREQLKIIEEKLDAPSKGA